MLISKCVLSILILCAVRGTLSKPTENYLTEGRGIGSTLWGWLTYPFYWWSYNEEISPVNEHLIASTTYGPYHDIEIGKHNVTVWCNDQTCTTMKCDKHGCRNNTCNIYDTDMTGECREYHITVDEQQPTPPKPTEALPKPIEIDTNQISSESPIEEPNEPNKVIETTTAPAHETNNEEVDVVAANRPLEVADIRPLELEAVLSSTVTEHEGIALDEKDGKSTTRHSKM